jgi:hypothetical protein
MDASAISLCKDNRLPIIVFDMTIPGNIKRVVLGERVGSLVRHDDDARAVIVGRGRSRATPDQRHSRRRKS